MAQNVGLQKLNKFKQKLATKGSTLTRTRPGTWVNGVWQPASTVQMQYIVVNQRPLYPNQVSNVGGSNVMTADNHGIIYVAGDADIRETDTVTLCPAKNIVPYVYDIALEFPFPLDNVYVYLEINLLRGQIKAS